MTRLRVLLMRLVAMIRGGRREEALSDEITLHLELLAEEYRRRGLPGDEARLAAHRAFGGVMQVRETYRRQQRLPSIDAFAQDVRFALRVLRRERTSTIAAVGLLALGVGATVVMADMLDRLLVRPPAHVSAPERVARIYSQTEDSGPSAMVTNYPTVERLAAGVRDEVEFMAVFTTERLGLGRGPEARRLDAVSHSRAYFDVLGLTPQLGVLPSERRPEVVDAVVISHGVWQGAFGGAPDIIGRTMHLGRRLYTIVAVTPPGFRGIDTDPVDVWLPLDSRGEEALSKNWRTGTEYVGLRVVARLRAGIDRSRAGAHASTVYNSGPLPSWADGKPRTYRIIFGELPPARHPGGTDETRVVWWIGAVSGLVLLIACGNVANLLLVSGLRRSSELALKTALGATRGRLVREVLIEAGLLALAAGILGFAAVLTAGTVVRRLLLPPVMATVTPLDGRFVLIAVVVCVVAAFLLGTIPALRLTSRQILTPGRVLHTGRPSRMLDAFVGVQVALSVPLIIGASLFSLSLWQARQVNFGLESTNVAIVEMNGEEVGTPTENHAAHRRIHERLALLPHVQSAALVQTVPMRNAYATGVRAGGTELSDGPAPHVNAVDPTYFSVMGMRFVAGQSFTAADNVAGARPVAVINEVLANTLWPGQSGLGRCVHIGFGDTPCAEVVGVVANTVAWPGLNFSRDMTPMCFLPIEQRPDRSSDRAVLVRTTTSVDRELSFLRAEAQSTAPNLPYIDVWAFDDLFQPALKPLRLGSLVFIAFGALALVIAGVGLAAVTAYGVARRTRELGIRLVLGAEPAALVRDVLGRNLVAVILGLIAGCLLAYGGSRGLRSLLFGVAPDDLRVYMTAALVMIVVSSVAAWLPARRAGRVEPAAVLRTE